VPARSSGLLGDGFARDRRTLLTNWPDNVEAVGKDEDLSAASLTGQREPRDPRSGAAWGSAAYQARAVE
jgi:hypothetical protein